ncbi:hypothetical protein MOQ72_27055 [Saccharopolyspora sp. K220]|uniref:hypothetical protein n=1 Tax=Saccharopolyspora soli TaxID=2926618 RepID=UPI001F5836BA|nr:hypothetical protein [Saccharopolyspora soli]MCI2421107.1 hypothetical protein [Saccharopolyspora soli]
MTTMVVRLGPAATYLIGAQAHAAGLEPVEWIEQLAVRFQEQEDGLLLANDDVAGWESAPVEAIDERQEHDQAAELGEMIPASAGASTGGAPQWLSELVAWLRSEGYGEDDMVRVGKCAEALGMVDESAGNRREAAMRMSRQARDEPVLIKASRTNNGSVYRAGDLFDRHHELEHGE